MITNTSDTLNAYIDGSLGPEERSALEAALDQDRDLREELAELQATARLLATLPEYTPPRSLRLASSHAKPTPIVTAQPVRTAIRLLPLVRTLSVAAAIVFMVVAGSLFFDINGQSMSDAGQTLQQQNVIMGETTGSSQASEQAGDEAAASDSAGGLVQRGDAASAAESPMEDLSAYAPEAPAGSNEGQAIDGSSLPFGATERGETDHANWIFISILLGGVTIALGAAWLGVSATARQHRS